MDKLNNNLIDFSKFIPNAQTGISSEAARKYFISQVLPYVSEPSLQRLIAASISADQQSLRIELMRMYIESELSRPSTAKTNQLQLFFKPDHAK
jgi:hypothetical protein